MKLDKRATQPGQHIGKFRLLLPIGVGGMAEVWAACPNHSGLTQVVALKLIREEIECSQEHERMFVDEAMISSSTAHPNLCEVRHLGRDGNRLYMILELVAGDSLANLLRATADYAPIPAPIAARIISQACAGLHAAHEAVGKDGESLGIVHRDVSPSNILLSTTGHVKVSDFGIAKARHQLHARTQTGQIKGKFAYIPPEQVAGRGVDRRADVYALGCVLYVATLGRKPFGSGPEALARIVDGAYAAPARVRPGYPEGLQRIITKALAPAPDARFSTAREMRLALEHWLMEDNQLVMDTDVGELVRSRLNPERKAVLEALRSTGRALPEEWMQRVLDAPRFSEVPTASGIAARGSVDSQSSTLDGSLLAEEAADSSEERLGPTWRPKREKGDSEQSAVVATGNGSDKPPGGKNKAASS